MAPAGRYGTRWQNRRPHQHHHHHRHHPRHYHHSNTIIIKNRTTCAIITIEKIARMNYDPKKSLIQWKKYLADCLFHYRTDGWTIWRVYVSVCICTCIESIVQYGWVGIVFVFVFGTAYFNLDGWVTGTNNRKTLPPIGDCGTTIPDRSVPELRDVLGILRLILRSQLYFTSPYITVSVVLNFALHTVWVVLYFALHTVPVPLAWTLLEHFLFHTGWVASNNP